MKEFFKKLIESLKRAVFIKKQIVNLKRAPHRIPLVILVICCIIYTFNLTVHSNASIYVSSNIVALFVFIITLASILTIFTYNNAYTGGRKRIGTLILAFVLVLLQILLDALYLDIMFFETVYREVPLTTDIAISMNMTMVHIGSLVVALAAILLKPVYHKLLLKIDTSVLDAEENNISDYTSIDDEYPDKDELDW